MRSALPMARDDGPLVFYDMTRLVNKRFAPIGTGIDRVDLRFAQAVLEEYGENCFPVLRVGRKAIPFDRRLAQALTMSLERSWFHGHRCDYRTGYTLELAGLTQTLKGPLAYLFPEIHNLTTIHSIIFISSKLRRHAQGHSIPRISWPRKSPRDWIAAVLVSFPTAALVAFVDLLLKLPIILSRAVHYVFRKDAREIIPKLLAGGSSGTYVVCSPGGVATLRGWLPHLNSACGLRTVAYIHDILPIEYPEYYKPGKSAYLADLLSELVDCRATFVANSRETADRLKSYSNRMNWKIGQIPVVYPGIENSSNEAKVLSDIHERSHARDEPYFVVVGTIEPRKNHALLLQVWRDLVQIGIEPTPRLHIVGSRGWGTDKVLSLLDRCGAIQPYVTEHSGLPDDELRNLIRGARAVLFPTFAEGFGLPLVEALQLGTKVIASDLPVFREIAGEGPLYLSPLDSAGWKQAIVESITETQSESRPIARTVIDKFSWQRRSKELIELTRAVHDPEQASSQLVSNPDCWVSDTNKCHVLSRSGATTPLEHGNG